MIKTIKLFLILFFLSFSSLYAAEDVVGFWKTFDDKTGKPQSIMAIYEQDGKFFGRIIATYDNNGTINDSIEHPKDKAPGVKGYPYYSGLDILWDLKKEDGKYKDGKIMDPEKGKVYDAEMWLQDGKLYVRGEIWVFGQNQIWQRATDADFPQGFKKPDLTSLKPDIHKVINKDDDSDDDESSSDSDNSSSDDDKMTKE